MHFCQHCETGILNKISADEPWHPDYYICDICDSTYNVDEIEDDEIDFENERGTEMTAYTNVCAGIPSTYQLVNSLK